MADPDDGVADAGTAPAASDGEEGPPPDAAPTARWSPSAAGDEDDDLAEVSTSMSRLGATARRLVAAAVALALLVPAGAWLADEIDFRRSGSAVVATVEGELSGTDAGGTVVLVRTVGCAGRSGSGSGFVVSTPQGPALVTNRHVVEDATQVGVRSLGGDSELQVRGVRSSASADVAVLEVAEPDQLPPPLRLREQPAATGERVRVVGFPAARPFTDAGEVAGVHPERLLLDLQVAAGASGSPVVDRDGTVVGQIRAVTAQGQGVATPTAALRAAIADAEPHQVRC